MALKHSMKLIGTCTVTTALLLASPASAFVSGDKLSEHVCATDAIQKDNRPKPAERLFRSQAVENEIIRFVKAKMVNPTLLFIQVIFMPCGCAIPVHKYGLTYNLPTPIRN